MSLQRRPIIAVMAAEELHELNDELGPVVERRGFQQCLFRSGIEWRDLSDAIDQRLRQVDIKLNGDASLARREFETPPSINGRIGTIEYTLWNSTSAPTQTAHQSYEVASNQFTAVLAELKSIDGKIKEAENVLERSKAPYTPGRFPEWNK